MSWIYDGMSTRGTFDDYNRYTISPCCSLECITLGRSSWIELKKKLLNPVNLRVSHKLGAVSFRDNRSYVRRTFATNEWKLAGVWAKCILPNDRERWCRKCPRQKSMTIKTKDEGGNPLPYFVLFLFFCCYLSRSANDTWNAQTSS